MVTPASVPAFVRADRTLCAAHARRCAEHASKLSALWGPFLLITIGNSGRVLLQIGTDFLPNVAYPLVGLTGFFEVTALAWWGIGLWRVMNRSRTERAKVPSAPFPILGQ